METLQQNGILMHSAALLTFYRRIFSIKAAKLVI